MHALLACPDGDPDCHHFNRDWRVRLGVMNTDDERGLSISGLLLLPDQLRGDYCEQDFFKEFLFP
ncbi:MAG: hypothetical protein R3330_10845 [Saprospiraceae bacterium]|nr:hypothetical protein [Saprospiraceae bacterium]